MNYAAHYERLIQRARGRVLTGYLERHHVIPVCMGGDNSAANLVGLTPEEHYVGHQLLVRIHPHNRLLVHAAVCMAKRCTGNKAYGWLRRRIAKAMIGNTRTKGMHFPQLAGNKHKLGKTHSLESKARMSVAQMGNKKGRGNKSRTGIHHSPETRAKMSATRTGMKPTLETRVKLSASAQARKATPQARARMSEAAIRRDPRSRDEMGRYGSHSSAPNKPT